LSRWPSLSGHEHAASQIKFLAASSSRGAVRSLVGLCAGKKVTIQAHGKYAKLGGRADLLVAMVKDRFRKVGEAIGVELELKSPEE
jgi:hypothetical protein